MTMTLPQNVADAVTRLDRACVDGRVMPSDDAWQTIRAHLVSQEAEIADLISKRDFLLRHYSDAESRVAAANALLSESWGFMNNEGIDWFGSKEDAGLLERIQAHLQGAGDE